MDPSSRQELRELHADFQSGIISQADYDDLKAIVLTRVKKAAGISERPSDEAGNPKSMQSDTVELDSESEEDLPAIIDIPIGSKSGRSSAVSATISESVVPSPIAKSSATKGMICPKKQKTSPKWPSISKVMPVILNNKCGAEKAFYLPLKISKIS